MKVSSDLFKAMDKEFADVVFLKVDVDEVDVSIKFYSVHYPIYY